MPNIGFRLMSAIMAVQDRVSPFIDERVATFGIQAGMTVVDYGCGPGRYTRRFSKLVGESGMVFAVDVQPLAIEAVKRMIGSRDLRNVVPVLANGYETGLPDHVADIVCAIDMFFALKEPSTFLSEVRRIVRPDGALVLDDGHESRASTLRKIEAAGGWKVVEESKDHLKYKPV
jgi:ubiquinone/menaquinone biosynthesis C-methylase UbiE